MTIRGVTGNALDVTGLTKAFGSHTVLHGIDLGVTAGTITAVVGASGCGKTTLLRLVAGFENPDAGTVSIAGRQVAAAGSSTPAHRRDVGYVAQDGALFPHLTVGQNIAYGLSGRRNVQPRVAELLATVSLDESYAARRPHELSGGQQQRVALARALARQPALMLLDEPFSALDTGLRASTRKAVATLLSDAGVTTLIVTHDQEEALSIADQVAVMRDGRFTKVGTPQAVYREPNDRFTAEFLGDCVLLPCTVTGGVATSALGRLPVRGSVPDGGGTLMLRPEQLEAAAVSDDDRSDGMATVLASEFRGHDVLLTVDLGGDAAPITVRQHSVAPPAVDAKVRIHVTGAAVVFDDRPRDGR
ncbi:MULTISPECIES: ABC transporter ATP-binding protein [Mycolicibacterium]|jgi:iron(III) transport system ATP-binding protein|uniref:ABC-type quaternary amine transporter n=2 Tax=Mycolicibacterium TaxID=1866885 RepID=A0A1X1TGH2_9MYCO|nr:MULTISPECIES: ABC transporter ATP-binding protein [Mycolicibacterium]MCV7270200.1 ABC transporter ATP-binding protein [Mycolicibacterium doricum]MDA4102726.1 sugar ABC transporter [Mycolicibacterium monacense DSM 44395]OBB75837.1 sugar ABC transporter [Mycolicibacterium monacense]OBF53963.1 sugar ABC transporter [Mycolicibacterium monacense]ORB16382.1 ABC transporter ATP-binding protein [Mycolicibacterium monacense DSM 44395]